MKRRSAIQILTGTSLSISTHGFGAAKGQHKIGACDWSIGKKQDIEAFSVAKKIGLEGIQVSFSTPGSEFDLRDPKIRQQYYERVDATGINISSLGMGILNQIPLSTEPETIDWLNDAIDVMDKMEKEAPDKATKVCLLAFFGKGDINGKPDLMNSVIKKLKTIAGKAEDHGVVFGIESLLSSEDHLKIIEGVGSNAIQVYYDSANSNRMGYNIYEEVVEIGGERICEVHCKENKGLIGEGDVDFEKFRDSLNKAGYRGWLIIEGSKPKGMDIVEAYRKNFATIDRIYRS